ncbi:MAG TPA: VCBS repeat-containing protein [Planctomycetota bacterium]|nr:VCBS repeat-containing protein [Planctomycetota bacterium]
MEGSRDLLPRRIALTSFCSAFAIALVISPGLEAQRTFVEPSLFPLELRPTRLCLDDFDQDGRSDLAVAHSASGRVSVFLGLSPTGPDAGLDEPREYAVALSPVAISSGDLDRSGFPDLFVVNSGSASASVLLNRGDGTFREAQSIPLALDPRVGQLADLDRDGNLDAVTGSVSSRELWILLGDGRGGFEEGERVIAGGNPHSIALEDFDGDGRVDIAVLFANNFVGGANWIRGRGDGTFDRAVRTTFGAVDDAVPRHLATGDFDRDGRLDLGVVTDDERLLLLRFQGDGTFRVEPIATVPVDRAEFVQAADFDRDGLLDLMTPLKRGGDSGIRIHRGLGDGSFSHFADVFLGEVGSDALLADLDKDGFLELVAAGERPRGILLVRGTGPGRLGVRATVPLGAGPRALRAIDMDQDGVNDLLAMNSGALHTVKRTSAGSFERVLKRDFPGRALEDLVVAGFGPDGPGVALVDIAQSEVLVTSIDPQGATLLHHVASVPERLAAGDFDGDHLADLAVTHGGLPEVTIILRPITSGSGAGDDGRLEVRVGSGQTAIDAGDVDGDGRLDLVVGTRDGIRILLGDGTGRSFDVRAVPGPTAPRALRVADTAGDGGMDVVLAAGTKIVILEAPLAAGGPVVRDINLGSEVRTFDLSDLNGDGRLDIVSTLDDEVAVSLATEGGGHAREERYRVGSSPRAVRLAALHPDGGLDCATADFGSSALSILEGAALDRRVRFRRGDADLDGVVLLTDAVLILNVLFRSNGSLGCLDAADADDDGKVSLTDAAFVLNYLFVGGPRPSDPGPKTCGTDPSADPLPDCPPSACR